MFSQLTFVIFLSVFSVVFTINEGDTCTLKDSNESGVCTHIRDCPNVYAELKSGILPKNICKFLGTIAVVCCTNPSPQPPPQFKSSRIVCYFSSWAVYRAEGGTFDVEDIDPTLCTHLVYAYAGLSDEAGIRVVDEWNSLSDNYGKDAYGRFVELKKRAPWVKLMIAVGSYEEGSVKFSKTFRNETLRGIFVKNTVDFIKLHGFDGIDLDWEYPAERGGAVIDRKSYVHILKALREEFDKHGYLLSIVVSPLNYYIKQSYNLTAMSQYVDFINLKAIDYHGAWDNKTGHCTPLYRAAAEKGTTKETFNIDDNIKAWLENGAIASKLILAISTFGRSYTLASSECTLPHCPIKAYGTPGTASNVAGFLGYNEICAMETQSVLSFDEEAHVPYLVKGDQWVTYDNPRSIQDKINYITQNKLGGALVLTVDTDDFSGDCGKGKFPLLSHVNNALKNAPSA